MDVYTERKLRPGGDSVADSLELMKSHLELVSGAKREDPRRRRARHVLKPVYGRSGGQRQR
jgi:hypothetical protein